MKTFKYKILKVKLEDIPEELLSHFPLLDMGREGWELIEVIKVDIEDDFSYYHYFKKEVIK